MGSSVILPVAGQPKQGADPAFKSAAIPNVVTFGLDRVGPPSPLYIQRDDVLVVEFISSTGDTLVINGRILLAPNPRGGQPDAPGSPDPSQTAQSSNLIIPINGALAFTSGPFRTQKTLAIPLTEGYLLSLGFVGSNTAQRGISFVRAWLNRGPLNISTPNTVTMLLADYVSNTAPVGWPAGRILFPTEGPGNLYKVSLANPAAGADFAFSVPLGARWRWVSLAAVLTASATVGNRIVHGVVQDVGGNTVFNASQVTAQTAGQAITYSFAPGLTSQNINDGAALVTLPGGLWLQGGAQIKSSTTGILAGDQWSAINAIVEEWLDAL